MQLIVHNARLVDVDGIRPHSWVVASAHGISAVGTGDSWREFAATDSVVTDAGDRWLTPGFIDIHQHGGAGFDYEHEVHGIRQSLAMHRSHGTTRSVLSIVTGPLDDLCASLEAIAALDDSLVLGSHLEGPFLATSHRGAHPEQYLRLPDRDAVSRLLDAAGGTLRQVTLAPELPGAFDAIHQFTRAGVVVAVGHTAADAATATRAFDAGARILTHAFNGMKGIHHRDPGPVTAAALDDRVTLELILDGHHVDVDVAQLLFRLAPGRVALITDAMAAAGASDGDYILGGQPVAVERGVARLTGGSRSIAGSTLTQDAALRNAVSLASLELVEAVAAVTSVPAAALGLGDRFGRIGAGYAADFVLLDDSLNVVNVWADAALIA